MPFGHQNDFCERIGSQKETKIPLPFYSMSENEKFYPDKNKKMFIFIKIRL